MYSRFDLDIFIPEVFQNYFKVLILEALLSSVYESNPCIVRGAVNILNQSIVQMM